MKNINCDHENCDDPTIPGGRRLHRYLHDNHTWYRNWHHHQFRFHFHLGAVILAASLALVVLFTPNSTGLKAEVGGYPLAGRLLIEDQPISDGFHDVEFKIYSVQNGGLAIWSELHRGKNRVSTVNGYFVTELGRLTLLDNLSLGEGTYYLGLSVDGQPELVPRWEIDQLPLVPLE